MVPITETAIIQITAQTETATSLTIRATPLQTLHPATLPFPITAITLRQTVQIQAPTAMTTAATLTPALLLTTTVRIPPADTPAAAIHGAAPTAAASTAPDRYRFNPLNLITNLKYRLFFNN